MLDLQEVRTALEATGDAELETWIREPKDIVVKALDNPPLEHHALFRVTSLRLSHPASFYVARPEVGEPYVLSRNADSVSRLVWSEPALRSSDELPRWMAEFACSAAGKCVLLETADQLDPPLREAWSAPKLQVTDEHVSLDALIRDSRGWVHRWDVQLREDGTSYVESERIDVRKGGTTP